MEHNLTNLDISTISVGRESYLAAVSLKVQGHVVNYMTNYMPYPLTLPCYNGSTTPTLFIYVHLLYYTVFVPFEHGIPHFVSMDICEALKV